MINSGQTIWVICFYWPAKKKLRKATYTAAVCKSRGDIFWFGSFPSVAQLISAFHYLIWFDISSSVAQLSSAFSFSSCFPNAADVLPLSRSSTSMTLILCPKKYWVWKFDLNYCLELKLNLRLVIVFKVVPN